MIALVHDQWQLAQMVISIHRHFDAAPQVKMILAQDVFIVAKINPLSPKRQLSEIGTNWQRPGGIEITSGKNPKRGTSNQRNAFRFQAAAHAVPTVATAQHQDPVTWERRAWKAPIPAADSGLLPRAYWKSPKRIIIILANIASFRLAGIHQVTSGQLDA